MGYSFFDKYITTHFEYNTNITDLRRRLEYRSFELNTEFSKVDRQRKILEIGFGTGIFLEYLKSLNFVNVEGIEVSEECFLYSKEKVDYKLYLESDLNTFSEKNKEKYDYIVLFDVLEHIKKSDLQNFLENIKFMLSDNGYLLIRVPNSANPFNQLYWSDITHEFFYNSVSLNQVLKISGFKQIQISNWKEEDILFKSKITNFTSIIFTPLIRLFLGLIRTGQIDSQLPFSRNLYARVSKD